MNSAKKSLTAKDRRLARERKQRREAIIKTAEEIFINQGFENAMVDQIAQYAGYSKATIYNYFESKEDLFTAIVAKAFEKLFEILKTRLNQPDSKNELRDLGDAYLIYVDEYPSYAALFDEGHLSLVITRIIQKEETNQSLTEAEKEFRIHQLEIQKLMMEIITQTIRNAGLNETKLDPFAVIMVLSTLNSTIRELVMRGKRTNQPQSRSKEYLTILFNIIDKGLKYYDK